MNFYSLIHFLHDDTLLLLLLLWLLLKSYIALKLNIFDIDKNGHFSIVASETVLSISEYKNQRAEYTKNVDVIAIIKRNLAHLAFLSSITSTNPERDATDCSTQTIALGSWNRNNEAVLLDH
jgi:hypothetical protein